MVNMEVCANSVRSALAAQEGGAIRVELCDNLPEGGTTPSYSTIALAKKMLSIKVYPIIRPRGGDFLYSDLEFNLMKDDIKICKSLNCDGVVIGILKADGSVDKERCAELIAEAKPMPVTFHRAFDMSNDMEKALEDIIELGCERILTSGGEASAIKGADMLARLIKQADGRIIIMPGAGVSAANIADIIKLTGAKEFHASARHAVKSEMQFRNPRLSMGSVADEFSYDLTDSETVKNLISLANKPA
ncbi:copper homeostasis protein CutC [Pedobacter ginsengisoli]|uniref:PF03932 family protein CutC n=1 Tax=Pedobacter ginsengisoli TaxID=363852 RepID=A0A2D1U4N9_9SPHI|nr:copper homeostasis protein CutC [Pedobacter ginsengisoli]ATP56570.1 copper homeostasis protein CutC [Pedobacter ginsengisoli]